MIISKTKHTLSPSTISTSESMSWAMYVWSISAWTISQALWIQSTGQPAFLKYFNLCWGWSTRCLLLTMLQQKKQSGHTHGDAVNLGEVCLVIVMIESPQPYSERSVDQWHVFGVLWMGCKVSIDVVHCSDSCKIGGAARKVQCHILEDLSKITIM